MTGGVVTEPAQRCWRRLGVPSWPSPRAGGPRWMSWRRRRCCCPWRTGWSGSSMVRAGGSRRRRTAAGGTAWRRIGRGSRGRARGRDRRRERRMWCSRSPRRGEDRTMLVSSHRSWRRRTSSRSRPGGTTLSSRWHRLSACHRPGRTGDPTGCREPLRR